MHDPRQPKQHARVDCHIGQALPLADDPGASVPPDTPALPQDTMDNPYQPPQSPIDQNPTAVTTSVLASRWMRLLASLIDTFIGGGVSVVLIFVIMGLDLKGLGNASLATQAQLAVMGVAAFLALHGYLLAKKGQTIGKLVCGIRIAKLDGTVPEFMPLILKRYLPVWLVVQIPILGGFLNLANVLFIFRADKRCVHDLIAGTRVIKAS